MKKICLLCAVCLGLTTLGQAQSENLFTSSTINEEANPAPKDGILDTDDPIGLELKASVPSGHMTITESMQLALTLEDELKEYSTFASSNKSIGAAFENYENEQLKKQRNEGQAHLQDALIGFILEAAITCLLLQIVFSLNGLSGHFGQAALFSFALAAVGAVLDYFLFIGLFNPFRIVLGMIVLGLLVISLKDVRKWGTAIRIVLLSRIISLGIIWTIYTGSAAIFGL